MINYFYILRSFLISHTTFMFQVFNAGSVIARCEKQQNVYDGLKIQTRMLAYKYAVRKNLLHPSSSNKTEMAGKNGLKGFRQRNSNQSHLIYFPE